MPAGSDLPGKGWVKVGNNSFAQFDLPDDTSDVPAECEPVSCSSPGARIDFGPTRQPVESDVPIIEEF